MAITAETVSVRVLLFARYAELAGTAETVIELAAPASVGDVLAGLRVRHPAADALPARPLAAVNLRQADLDHRVVTGDEVAFLPPLSGG